MIISPTPDYVVMYISEIAPDGYNVDESGGLALIIKIKDN